MLDKRQCALVPPMSVIPGNIVITCEIRQVMYRQNRPRGFRLIHYIDQGWSERGKPCRWVLIGARYDAVELSSRSLVVHRLSRYFSLVRPTAQDRPHQLERVHWPLMLIADSALEDASSGALVDR